MRAVIQRVADAQVTANGRVTGEIGKGLLILLGVLDADTQEDLDYLVRKISNMRIFEDADEKMNLSVKDVGGSLLVVSQFTLFADTRKGNRPGFSLAGRPDFSKDMYLRFIDMCRSEGLVVGEGEFGAHMDIRMTCDGPVTILIDSKNR